MSSPTAKPDGPRFRAWLIVALLWVVACFNWTARGMITTMHQSVLASIPMNEASFGLLTSLFAWVYAGLSPFAGFLSDRFSRSKVIVLSLVAWSAITLLTGFARNFTELLVLRGLIGVFEATFLPAALALATDYHRTNTRSLAVGVIMSGTSVGSALAALGGSLSERHAWTYPFFLVGAAGLIYAGVLGVLLRDAPTHARPNPAVGPIEPKIRFDHALGTLLRRPAFLLVLAYYAISGVGGWMVLGWMPTFIQERFHLAQGAAGFSATGYFNAAALVGVFLGGILADRWSRTHPRGCILVPAIALCFAVPGIFLTAVVPLLPVAMFGLVAFGLAGGFSDANMMPILCLISDSRYRASAYGLLNFVGAGAGGLSVYLGGLLQDRHYSLVQILTGTSLMMVLCPVLLFLVRPPKAADMAGRLETHL